MRHLLEWLAYQPDLLAEAPEDPNTAAAQARVSEAHACLKCGRPAEGVFWIRPSEMTWMVPRWMDLCPRCCVLVYEVARSEP